jgi:acyl CoA:acetate/3-ketoacid CoA transferase alpha subunit
VAEIVSLADAVSSLVRDGDAVALEGFTHLIPHAAGHELRTRATTTSSTAPTASGSM